MDRIVVFQYNPESLHRKVEQDERLGEASAGRRTPQQLILCTLVFDASDALERPDENPDVLENGISPNLAALELLMYRGERRKPGWWEFWRFGGGLETEPLTLFVWGPKRIVPVRLVRLDIAELQHDQALCPIRATVDVKMQVVAEEDLPRGHPAISRWRQHMDVLESLASEGYSATPPVEIK